MLANYEISSGDKKFIGWHLIITVPALSIGSLFVPLQAFAHAGLDLYPYLQPLFQS